MNNYTLTELESLVREVFKIAADEPFPLNIRKQINRYVLDDRMTYKEIGRCIYYYVQIKKKTIDLIYGISFVQYVKKDALAYFNKLDQQKQQQEEAAKKFTINSDAWVVNVKEIIKQSKKKQKRQQLSFDNIKLEEDDNGHK